MTFVYLDGLHFEMWDIAFVHEEMKCCNKVAKVGVYADVVIKGRF